MQKITIGQLARIIDGGVQQVVINDSGEEVFKGLFCDLLVKYYERNIKHLHIKDSVLFIDLSFDY